MQARIIGVQEQALFQKCVEAAEYMKKEHGWVIEVVRNFEYQFVQERATLVEVNNCEGQAVASAPVAALVVGDFDNKKNEQEHQQVQPQEKKKAFKTTKFLSGDDFLAFVMDNSDFKIFTGVKDDDPESYVSLARKAYRAFLRSTGCSFAWMLLKQGDVPLGRVVFQLYSEKAPRTCQNFLYLCRGDLPDVTDVEVPLVGFKGDVKLSYKESKVFRVVKNGWVQAGDIVGEKKGNSGYSIYGESMPTETMGVVPHDSLGVVGMSWGPGADGVGGPHTSASSFYITLGPSAWMDKGYCSFGRVVSGLDVVRALGNVETHHSQAPKDDIIIADAGEVNTDP